METPKFKDSEIVKINDPVKLLQEIEAFFTFNNPPSEKDVRLIRASINYCIDNLPVVQQLPESDKPEGKSAEEIRDKYTRAWFNDEDDLDDPQTGYMPWPEVLEAMKEYASQSKGEDVMVTDEEIEEAAKDHIRYTYTPITKREVVELLISFAKAMRDGKIKSLPSKSERELLITGINDFLNTAMGTSVERFVDEFLQNQ